MLCSLFAVITVILSAVPCYADDAEDATLPPEIEHAKAAYLYNFENDAVLLEYNITDVVYPASTVKLMTAIVAFEYFANDLDYQITVTQDMLNEVAGNRIGFSLGEVVTVRQMLSCMLINSANDAAIILAHAVAGSTEAFVSMMNERAAQLGAYETYYMNPTGLHSDYMVTTARDTATIAKHAYSIDGFIDITSTSKYVMEATNTSDFRNIYNRNCLVSNYYSMSYYYPRAIGMNAGATNQGGYSIVAAAADPESGLTYLAVILGSEEIDGTIYTYVNVKNMLDWAFEAYGYATVLSSEKMICEIPVTLSSTLDYVTLVPKDDITFYLPTSVELESEIHYSYNTYTDTLEAPIEAGQEAGTITVLYGDEILGSTSLITTSSITRSEFLFFLARVKEFSTSRLFIGTVAGFVILSTVYALIVAAMREKKLRHSYRRK